MRNLSDPECRKGYVFLPLGDLPNAVQCVNEYGPQKDNVWLYLSKPLASNIRVVLENYCQQLQDRAIALEPDLFFRSEEGIVVAVDLAGFGAACKYARERMHSFGQPGSTIADEFRTSVASLFYGFLARVGVSQVHTAGDGMLCGLPRRQFGNDTAAIIRLFLQSYRSVLALIDKLNECIQEPTARVGSRIAVHYGPYRFGRIARARSFAADFDGETIIECSRLESGLREYLRKQGADAQGQEGPNGGTVAPGKHNALFSNEVMSRAGGLVWDQLGLAKVGEFEVPIKERIVSGAVFRVCAARN